MINKNKGVTLVEMLVVVTIMSILIVTLYTVFKSGVDAWTRSETRLDIYQNARVILGQLSRELPGAFVGGAAGATFIGQDNDPDTIEFVTSFADSIYMVEYSTIGSDPYTLRRSYDENPEDCSNPDYTPTDFSDDGIIGNIDFTYWVSGATDWSTTAGGAWSTTTALPQAVKVELELQDQDGYTYPFETYIYLPGSE